MYTNLGMVIWTPVPQDGSSRGGRTPHVMENFASQRRQLQVSGILDLESIIPVVERCSISCNAHAKVASAKDNVCTRIISASTPVGQVSDDQPTVDPCTCCTTLFSRKYLRFLWCLEQYTWYTSTYRGILNNPRIYPAPRARIQAYDRLYVRFRRRQSSYLARLKVHPQKLGSHSTPPSQIGCLHILLCCPFPSDFTPSRSTIAVHDAWNDDTSRPSLRVCACDTRRPLSQSFLQNLCQLTVRMKWIGLTCPSSISPRRRRPKGARS